MGTLSYDMDKWGQFGGADVLNADLTYNIPRLTESVPTNALQSMQAVASGGEAMGPWGGFFANMLQGVVNHSLNKDLVQAQAGTATQATSPAATPAAASSSMSTSTMLMLAAGALVAVVVVVKLAR